jgi:hypothetical protein
MNQATLIEKEIATIVRGMDADIQKLSGKTFS